MAGSGERVQCPHDTVQMGKASHFGGWVHRNCQKQFHAHVRARDRFKNKLTQMAAGMKGMLGQMAESWCAKCKPLDRELAGHRQMIQSQDLWYVGIFVSSVEAGRLFSIKETLWRIGCADRGTTHARKDTNVLAHSLKVTSRKMPFWKFMFSTRQYVCPSLFVGSFTPVSLPAEQTSRTNWQHFVQCTFVKDNKSYRL